jgi:hypothetical protein
MLPNAMPQGAVVYDRSNAAFLGQHLRYMMNRLALRTMSAAGCRGVVYQKFGEVPIARKVDFRGVSKAAWWPTPQMRATERTEKQAEALRPPHP